MGEKLIVGPFTKGLRTDVEPFNVDNDSFPVLINAYQWRGRIKRKRGTELWGRLQRFFNSNSTVYNTGTATLTLDANGQGNILINTSWALQVNSSIEPGNVIIIDSTGPQTYTDLHADGTLQGSSGGTGTINYASGSITIVGGAGHSITASFIYYPDLPVMGIEDFTINGASQFPNLIGFDTTYSYNLSNTNPPSIYDVSFYKNPPVSASLPGYTPKTLETPVTWNGFNYQQFQSVNYQGALWVTNGIDIPFTGHTLGMQFKPIVTVTVTSGGPPAIVSLNIVAHGLVVGDFIFINEVLTTTGINFQTGYVITVTDANNVVVELPNAIVATNGTGGIAQYLTNRSNPAVDCIRWYDGDPTNGSVSNPVLNGVQGWVNFMPPLSNLPYSIAEQLVGQYYLVGCRYIIPFKDRLLFFGPVIQTSTGTPIYLNDTVVYSQNGTPYYTASFSKNVALATTPTTAILTPGLETATAAAYFGDVTGWGGWAQSGTGQAINTIGRNEDVLIIGSTNNQARLVYSGDDYNPFLFYIINSEFGSGSTFSTIIMDKGVLTKGGRGFLLTSQTNSQRIDLLIPDLVFEENLFNNGTERITAARDYINEWVYFSYPSQTDNYIFPTRTLQYNYADSSWAIFYETYTTYGTLRQNNQFTWATVGFVYETWEAWNVPWNAGASDGLQPVVVGGNQQGFLLIRTEGTQEDNSLEIQNISFPATITMISQATDAVVTANNNFVAGQSITISGVVGMTQINNTYTVVSATPLQFTLNVNSTAFSPYISGGIATPSDGTVYCPNHCLNGGDYIIINNALGTIGPQINGKIFQVVLQTNNGAISTNGFNTDPPMSSGFTYLGNGLIKRIYNPFIQTRQFPLSWSGGRKTRIGPQQYLFSTTQNGQITLYIYLSEDPNDPYNQSLIVPEDGSSNNSLIYSTIVYTSPELYIQNCFNLPLGSIGNGVITTFVFNLFELFQIETSSLVPSTLFIKVGNVATFQDNGTGNFNVTGTGNSIGSSINYNTGIVTLVFTVAPLNQTTTTNFQYYVPNIQNPTAAQQSQIWHRLNTSLIGDTIQLGFTLDDAQLSDITLSNQFAEIELHGFVIDTSASQILA